MTENPIKYGHGHIFGGPNQLNLINYMSTNWKSSTFIEPEFLGFFPLSGNYVTWGVTISDIPCCAVHVFKTKPGFFWGDDEKDTVENAENNPWVLMFYGNDNTSCMLRFSSKEDAIEKLKTLTSIDIESGDYMFYNS